MPKPSMFGTKMQICSISIREEHKQLLLVLGRGNLSSGLRELVDRVGAEDLQKIQRRAVEIEAKEKELKAIRESRNRDKSLENAKAIPKKGNRVPGKKKGKRPVSGRTGSRKNGSGTRVPETTS